MGEVMMLGGVLYLLGSVVASLAFGMLTSRQHARVSRRPGHETLGEEIARLEQFGHTQEEIARLVTYRVAVRAGYEASGDFRARHRLNDVAIGHDSPGMG